MSDSNTAVASPAKSVPLVILSIGMLLMLAALDQTIVSTALPTIVADLKGIEQLSWVVTAYILSSTVSAPLYGKLGDLFGRRSMVMVSVSLFLIGSVFCGLAHSMNALIIARVIQGFGGGLFVLGLIAALFLQEYGLRTAWLNLRQKRRSSASRSKLRSYYGVPVV